MEKRKHYKRTALFAFSLLLGLFLVCILWVRKEQRQYSLNRQLISALFHENGKQALRLVEAGADPNTRYTPAPAPSCPTSRTFCFIVPRRRQTTARQR